MKKIIAIFGVFGLVLGSALVASATVYTIPEQTKVYAPVDVQPLFTTVDHLNETATLQLGVVNQQRQMINRISVTFPVSELGITTTSLETIMSNSTVVVDAIKEAVTKL